MAKKPKGAASAAPNPLAAVLASAVNATNTGQPYMATKESMSGLLAYEGGPLVEFNEAMKDDQNRIAFRATARGVEVHNSGALNTPAADTSGSVDAGSTDTGQAGATTGSTAAGSTEPQKVFTFDSDIALPAPRRGGRGQNAYGFEQMAVGQSFFLPNTTELPNRAKSMASTVSSASKRLAPKKFVVRSVDETAQGRGKGARIWRES